MFGLFDWLKIGSAAAAGALVAGSISYMAGYASGERVGYDRHAAEEAVADRKAELERRGDNATLQGMSDYDLCVAGLGGSGLSVDACEQLRGLREE